MLKIEISKIDELHSICNELNTIIYLQDFVNSDFDESYEKGHLFENSKSFAIYFLNEWSKECALKFKKLLDSDDFVKKIEI